MCMILVVVIQISRCRFACRQNGFKLIFMLSHLPKTAIYSRITGMIFPLYSIFVYGVIFSGNDLYGMFSSLWLIFHILYKSVLLSNTMINSINWNRVCQNMMLVKNSCLCSVAQEIPACNEEWGFMVHSDLGHQWDCCCFVVALLHSLAKVYLTSYWFLNILRIENVCQ